MLTSKADVNCDAVFSSLEAKCIKKPLKTVIYRDFIIFADLNKSIRFILLLL